MQGSFIKHSSLTCVMFFYIAKIFHLDWIQLVYPHCLLGVEIWKSQGKKKPDRPAVSIIPSSFSDVLSFKPADGNTNALGWQIYTFSPWANQDTRLTLFRFSILKKYFERDIEQMDYFLYPPISTHVQHFSPNICVRDSFGECKNTNRWKMRTNKFMSPPGILNYLSRYIPYPRKHLAC